MQEANSLLADETKWADELKGPIYVFSYRKTNSFEVAIEHIGNNKVDLLDNIYIYIFDVKVEETNFVLVNLFNPNTETEQVTIFLDLGKMLEAIKDFYDEHKVLVGNVYFYFWHILGFI